MYYIQSYELNIDNNNNILQRINSKNDNFELSYYNTI